MLVTFVNVARQCTIDTKADLAGLLDHFSRAEAALTNDLEGLGTLRQLLEAVELEGVLIQADALHANRPFSSTSPSAAPTS